MDKRKRMITYAAITLVSLVSLFWSCERADEQDLAPGGSGPFGETKSLSDDHPFITVDEGSYQFRICDSREEYLTSISGRAINYVCPAPLDCTAVAVVVENGSGGTFSFREGRQYGIELLSGEGQVLSFTFPDGYNACALAPPTEFHFEDGRWTLVGRDNDVVWDVDLADCAE